MPVESLVAPVATSRCFHCGEAVIGALRWTLAIDGRDEPMCCPGCQAAATAIRDFGLGDYYRQRDAYSPRPLEGADAARLSVYDDPILQARCVRERGVHGEATLSLSGMSCSACAWLLESRLGRLDGVAAFEVDFANRRALVQWDRQRTGLANVLGAIEALGYGARPFTPDGRREAQRAESAQLLREFGVACVFGMQVMMIATAYYFSEGDDMAGSEAGFLRWVCLVLTLPVLLYSARPFYRAAWRALAARAVNMDVPVALALTLAFVGSAWHTLLGRGEVYFDSVVMFVSLLSASRFLELRARVAAAAGMDGLAALIPDSATRVVQGSAGEALETVAVVRLVPGDLILVRPGETVPADGVVRTGESTLDEAILSGEAEPRRRGPGASVLGGSVNLESPLQIAVTAVAEASFAGHLATLVARAAATRPAIAEASQRLSRWFVLAVLLTSLATACGWAVIDPSRWFEATLAVLVVSCPCAFAIAVPAALATANAALLARSIAVLGGHALERLAQATHFVFDKTGTLTSGVLHLREVSALAPATADEVLSVACALAQGSEHPVARALRALPAAQAAVTVGECRGATGRGLSGLVQGRPARLGSAAFVAEIEPGFVAPAAAGDTKEVWVARDGRVLGRVTFDDPVRAECTRLFAWLRGRRLHAAIMSGDRHGAVAALAAHCGVADARGEMLPQDKLAAVDALQAAGAVVVMTGDGINDAPVLARADVSIAVADSAAAARQQADVLLLAPGIDGIRTVTEVAAFTRQIMRQNLLWAGAYNLLGVPLAALGLIPPWLAALGMSLSSLAVVANALRIRARYAAPVASA